MSLLNTQTNQGPTKAERLTRIVNELKNSPKDLAEEMFRRWERSFDLLWKEDNFISGQPITVTEKLEALGTDAKELFELNTEFTSFMLTQLTGKRDDLVTKIQEKNSTIPANTVNVDGTVTLN